MKRIATCVALALLMTLQAVVPATALAEPSEGESDRGRCDGRRARVRVWRRPPADLPLDHWAYPLLERLVARRVLRLDLSTLPVTRHAVAAALARAQLGGRAFPETPLTAREKWAIGRLKAELLESSVDEPILSVRDRAASVGLGVLVGGQARFERDGEETAEAQDERSESGTEGEFHASAEMAYELWGGVGDDLGFYTDASVVIEEQDGPRIQELSSRARTWRGVSGRSDRAYVKYERPHVSVAAGRKGPAWGRSPSGRLLISGGAPTLDGLEARFSAGPLSLHALHAFLERPSDDFDERELDDREQVFLGAHRFVFEWARGSVALSEAVVYSSTIPDPAYLNPLFPFYASQHNERENDNVFWSLDFVGRPVLGLEVYGEVVVDDLQYQRETEAPDKYGLTAGAFYCGVVGGVDYEAACEYTRVHKWTYTHRITEHALSHDGVPLGFDLGPDADRLRAELVCHPADALSLGLEYAYSRLGEGSIEVPFEKGEDEAPPFPSGSVTRVHRIGARLSYDDLTGLSAALGVAYELEKDDLTDDDAFELRAEVRYRI